MKYPLLAGIAALAGMALAEVPPVVIKGKKFFYSNNGTEFYIRGVAYQPDYNARAGATSTTDDYTDPLADINTCTRDIPYLVALRTNVVRTYAVNPNSSHDACMKALADAGIYVMTDLASPAQSIDQDSPQWTTDLFGRYAEVVDAFAGYSNVIGFFIGNEVANNPSNTDSMPFVKAAVRDMKAYIKEKGYRSSLAIGYATNDDKSIRQNIADYLVCDDESDWIDMFGYNIYEFCGHATYTSSTYNVRTDEFRHYPVPAFFSEYGCIHPSPRHFYDIPILYGPEMENVWSGGIVYMYYQTPNNYGLVSIVDDKVSELPDYKFLSEEIKSATPTGVNSADYTVTDTQGSSCPATNSDWLAAPTNLPPSPNTDLCECMFNSLTCVPKDGTSQAELIKNAFNYLYGQTNAIDYVAGVIHNGTTGQYGAYAMCNPQQQAGWAMNKYYEQHGKNGKACDFSGIGTTKAVTSASGSCATSMSSIGPEGTNSVSGGPVASGGVAATTTSGIAAPYNVHQAVYIGNWQVGAYIVTAVISGVSMIML
ncbi:1-3-beta-glucanosyltransferase gel4 [Penicillium riverlandense]|uniref:1-3-beta-glucanosyltransferase gel4 n=1 Tax=Penicillium riverlandense TaxID=1903569 RepID=UPI002547AD88|nr:1-3-beta-glucanosyltransferase gel4 [Penicillium riverlandense]KAJ5833906.1 1-3-beta-glucanosyltransferase gel4 [Penicillium riverlandense]